jgi:hypothetical protein
MNFDQQLQQQLLTITALKSSSPSSENSIWNIFYGFAMISIVSSIISGVKYVANIGKEYVNKKLEEKKLLLEEKINTGNKSEKSSIILVKNYKEIEKTASELVEAIIDYCCNLDTVIKVKYMNQYFINNKDEFEITEKIKGKVLDTKINAETGNIDMVSIQIYSNELNLSDLRDWSYKIHQDYKIKQKNNIGNNKFYFREITPVIPKNIDGTYRMETAPKMLNFTINNFETCKSLTNLFGEHIERISDKINHFMRNRDWYYRMGIPYTLGILMHGPPGCGKTSTIKAIARDTDRHIITVTLSDTTTKSQLNSLFYNESISVMENGIQKNYIIPFDKRLYVIEDIDCLTDIVSNRMENDKNIGSGDDRINLSYLLNVLDGVLETPGRILIMTTNYPEKIDVALIRPGRVDLNIYVGKATLKMVKDMYYFFFEKEIELKKEWNELITPAELCNIFNLYYDDESICYNKIVEKMREYGDDLYMIDNIIEINNNVDDILDKVVKTGEIISNNGKLLEKISNEFIRDDDKKEDEKKILSTIDKIDDSNIFKYSSDLENVNDNFSNNLDMFYDNITEHPTSLDQMSGNIDLLGKPRKISNDIENLFNDGKYEQNDFLMMDNKRSEELEKQLSLRNSELMSQINSYYGEGMSENLRDIIVGMRN